MITLGIDTSGAHASVALGRDGELLAERFLHGRQHHSAVLLPMLEDMLRQTGIAINEIGRIAVCAGPGSFTGVRIGVAAAKGLAFAAQLPCAGVSTLAAMAAGAPALPGTLCCALEARRGQVYAALFRRQETGGRRQEIFRKQEEGDRRFSGGRRQETGSRRQEIFRRQDGGCLPLERCMPDTALSSRELERLLPKDEPVWLLGDDVFGKQDSPALPADAPSCLLPPEFLPPEEFLPPSCAFGAILAAQEEDYRPAAALRAVYLRPSQAERERFGEI